MIKYEDHMLTVLDDAMMRIFSQHKTEAERRARLEQLEDEHIARKAVKEPELCANCMGSGEGEYDGTTCPVCHGRGTEKKEKRDEQS